MVEQGHPLRVGIMDRPSEVTVSYLIINIRYILLILWLQLSVRMTLGHMTVVTLATMMTVEEVEAGVGVMTTIVVVEVVVVAADGTMTATEIMTVETVIVADMVEIGMMTGGTRMASRVAAK